MRDLQRDTLFVACTRPAMAFGLPQEAFGILVMVGGEVWVLVQKPLIVGPIIGAAYLICWLLSAYDPHIFTALFLWLRTWGRCSINSDHWGGASISPTPSGRIRKASELVIHV